MIINFSIQNFGSVKDKQTLTFEADKSEHLESSYIINTNGLRLLKMALIYGANASGKTTILKALEFLRDIVLEPETKKTDELDFQPFLFDSETPKQNSILSIEFLANDTRYYYEVEFFKKAIVNEVLNFYNPNKANVFKRSTDLNHQYTEIKFGSKIKLDKTIEKNLEANTLWNNTVLGGFLKTNVDIKELKEAVEWFKNYLRPLIYTKTQLEGFVTSKIDKSELSKHDVINILKKADFHISDIVIQEEEKEMPNGFIDFLKKQLKDSPDQIKRIEEKGKVTSVNIEFEHTVNEAKYTLPIEMESQGTRRFYGFAGLLALLIKNSTAFPIDELESSLHPDLYIHFILSFLLNTNKSQLIATTHNREILDNKDVFRNDAIWFTDKNENCSTELYSLDDFDSSIVRNTTNILNAYKSGKLKATPNLGDNFIDLKI
ncbi:ATP-binding protein [uncultured Roseivirga sp.]|uniref:AAA family ATPase n=1 Tax=uncultured Roseivirga sp. TaxID=543088 RepID=UPI0030D8F158|tara:strand:- start:49094 stop:50392 length:1299 start_codon:yes stop_codon:yes gene_type:complete